MRQTVFGIFDSAADAQKAVKHLLEQGFTNSMVDIRARRSDEVTPTSSTPTSAKPTETKGDSFSSFFSNLFGSDNEKARSYSEVARRGSVVTVHTTSKEESDRAARILDKFGAIDAEERALQYRSGAERGEIEKGRTTTSGESIPVIEENLEVGKREVESGKVRVRSRIVERPVEEHLRLREEHVDVERRPVDRPATEADFRNFKEGETEIIEHEEVPVVNKEARVKEEVNLNKETRDRERVVRDDVRKTEVDVKKTEKDRDITDKNRKS